jgi:hypothetical protein
MISMTKNKSELTANSPIPTRYTDHHNNIATPPHDQTSFQAKQPQEDHLPQDHPITQKSDTNVRILYQNINGFKWWNNQQFDITHRAHLLQELSADFFGLAETNTNFRNSTTRQRFKKLIHDPFDRQISFQTSSSSSKSSTTYQPGGTISAANNCWSLVFSQTPLSRPSCHHHSLPDMRHVHQLWSRTSYLNSQIWDVLKPNSSNPNPNL